jgi:hypothetical protein
VGAVVVPVRAVSRLAAHRPLVFVGAVALISAVAVVTERLVLARSRRRPAGESVPAELRTLS